MSIKSWKTLDSKYIHKTDVMAVRVDRCETPSGYVFEPYVIETGVWVNVIAITKKREVVLVRQYRHGIGDVLLEIPAGVMDRGDANPQQAARRELLEETGYTCEKFIEVGKVYPNPATHTNMAHFFLALDVEKVSQQNLDESEEIEVSLVSLDEFISMANKGDLPQALHVSALFFALPYLE